VTFCGVCHSDLHALEGTPQGGLPLVPGHEFVGVVTEVGAAVGRFSVGDAVAVGNIVDSCGECAACLADRQHYCAVFPALTYGGRDLRDGSPTYGAYSTEYVVRDTFAFPLPAGLDPAAVAPLMCAGVTTWAPLRRDGVGPGTTVGIVGLGGLGHLAVKFAKALGARVAVFTTSAGKSGAALELGADEVVLSNDAEAMAGASGRFDYVLDTASGPHDVNPYLRTLRLGGTLCVLGLPPSYDVDPMSLLGRTLTVSGGAGAVETQEMLDFCAEHGIVADVEVLPLAEVATALDRLGRNDVRYRFVLDVGAGPSSPRG